MAKPATSMNHAYCGLAIRYHDLPKSVENIALLVVLGARRILPRPLKNTRTSTPLLNAR